MEEAEHELRERLRDLAGELGEAEVRETIDELLVITQHADEVALATAAAAFLRARLRRELDDLLLVGGG